MTLATFSSTRSLAELECVPFVPLTPSIAPIASSASFVCVTCVQLEPSCLPASTDLSSSEFGLPCTVCYTATCVACYTLVLKADSVRGDACRQGICTSASCACGWVEGCPPFPLVVHRVHMDGWNGGCGSKWVGLEHQPAPLLCRLQLWYSNTWNTMHTGANIAHFTYSSLPRTPQVLGVDPWDSVLPCLLVLAVVSSRVYIGRTCIPSAVTSCLLALLVVASAAMVRTMCLRLWSVP